jgi:hypothetical protein
MIQKIFQHLFKNDKLLSLHANYVANACIKGNRDRFVQYFDPENEHINFASCALHSATNGYVEIYKELMNNEKVYTTRKIKLSIPMHYSASLRNGYRELTEYMLSESFAYTIDVNTTKLACIKEIAQEYNNPAVVANFYYLLTEKYYEPSNEIKQWLEQYKPEMLTAINNRDLYAHLNYNISNTLKSNPIRKL